MKFVKKLTSLFLAVVMVMAMGITAFAAEAPTTPTATTYKISVAEGDTHTYTVYQVLTGDLTSEGVISNVKAGTAYNTNKGDVAAAAEALAALQDQGQALADKIAEYVNTSATPAGTVSSSGALDNLAPGYYFLVDTTSPVTEYDSKNTSVAIVLNKNTTVTKKRDTVTFEKKVQDINDTTDSAAGNLQDSADYDIGDKVPFTLTGTLPSNYASYSKYYYMFSDQMEKGLTLDSGSIKVYAVNGNSKDQIQNGYTVGTLSSFDSGFTSGFTVSFADLKAVTGVTIDANTSIVVEYTATLNANAVLGSTGNVNKAKLTYSNNPNKGGEDETGETPWDNVIVFTYKVIVNKYANSVADGNKLTGAEFTLSKKLKDGSTKDITTVKSDDGTSFEFKGLDDGDYVLTETKTPSGYNTIQPITFTVRADHTIAWDGLNRTAVLTSLTGAAASGEITFTANDDKSQLSTDVINKSGASLPSTGGMGTTVIYIAGIAMIVAAGVVVIARKRMA